MSASQTRHPKVAGRKKQERAAGLLPVVADQQLAQAQFCLGSDA